MRQEKEGGERKWGEREFEREWGKRESEVRERVGQRESWARES